MRSTERAFPHFPVPVLVLVLVAVLAPLREAAAAAAKPRVGVARFAGTGEGPVRAKVLKVIKGAGYPIVGSQQIDDTAAKAGANLDDADGWRAVARELNVSAFVTGEITRRKATLTVRNGADGGVLGEATFPGANAQKIAAAVAAGFWRELGPVIKRGRPPAGAKARSAIAEEAEPADSAPDEAGAAEPAAAAPPEEAPPPPKPTPRKSAQRAAVAEEDDDAAPPKTKASAKPKAAESRSKKKDDDKDKDDDDDNAPLPVALQLGVGGSALFRTVEWHQDVQDNFSRYSLAPGPQASVWLDFFPAAFFTGGLAAQIGLFGSFNHGFGVQSQTKAGLLLPTSFQDFLIGLKLRFPLGALSPYVSLAYGGQTFRLSVPAGASTPIPNFDYKLARAGAGTHIDLAPRLFADLGAGFVLATGVGTQAGEVGSPALFPRAKAYAVDASVSLGVRVLGPLAVRAGADIRQYGLDFHVRQTDTTPIAGGAIDRYITIWGGVALVLDGVEHESGADADADTDASADGE